MAHVSAVPQCITDTGLKLLVGSEDTLAKLLAKNLERIDISAASFGFLLCICDMISSDLKG